MTPERVPGGTIGISEKFHLKADLSGLPFVLGLLSDWVSPDCQVSWLASSNLTSVQIINAKEEQLILMVRYLFSKVTGMPNSNSNLSIEYHGIGKIYYSFWPACKFLNVWGGIHILAGVQARRFIRMSHAEIRGCRCSIHLSTFLLFKKTSLWKTGYTYMR